MSTLRELQLGFAEAVTSAPAAERFATRIRSHGLDGARRVQIYRNNLAATLSGALEAVFPVIRRLVGEGFFAAAARGYIRACPSVSGDIHRYGARFGAFLAALPGTEGLPYLSDVAALEWAYHEVFHTEPTPPLDADALRAVPPEQYAELRFALQPAARLLTSEYPVLHIWQVNQPDWQGEPRVDLGEGGCSLLVLRHGPGLELEALTTAEALWLEALGQDLPLVSALEQALAVDPDFDLATALARRLAQGVLVAAHPPRDAASDIHPNA